MEPYLLQTELELKPQLLQPFLIGEVLQPSGYLHDPPLDPLLQIHIFLVLSYAGPECKTPDGASRGQYIKMQLSCFITSLLVFHIITSWTKEKYYVFQRTSRSEKDMFDIKSQPCRGYISKTEIRRDTETSISL